MERVIDFHKEEYECEPDVIATAPGRINLIGEHTWFFKDKTMSMAVNLPVYVAVSKRSDSNLRFNFVQLKEKKRSSFSSLKYKKEDKWANALKAVVYGFVSSGYTCSGMNVTIYSDILPSAGFGITTAIKIASAWAVKAVHNFRIGTEQMLSILDKANKQFLGLMDCRADNFCGIFSKENCIVVTDHSKGTYELLPFKFSDRSIVLTDARVPRITTWNEESLRQPENVLLLGELKERKLNAYGGWHYEESPAEVNEVLSVVNEETRHRLLCIMNEHKCVLEACNALLKTDVPDFSAFARAVNRSHENMSTNFDISCPEIDWLLKRVQELDESPEDLRNPVNCGRITGKGFGRCTYMVLRNQDVDKYREKLGEYERIFGFKPECYVVKSAKGVKVL